MKHEADGIYYFTGVRAAQLKACEGALNAWNNAHTAQKQVPVTYETMRAQEDSWFGWGSIRWCIDKMYRHEKILLREYVEATQRMQKVFRNPLRSRPALRALVLMDLLAQRARREGRLK